MFKIFFKDSRFKIHGLRKAQTMLLTVFVISGTLMAVAIIGGILMIYQIRNAGDFVNSAKAIFAADAGINWWVYSQTNNLPVISSSSINTSFTNKASFEVIKLENGDAKIIGKAGNSKRAFLYRRFINPDCKYDLVLLVSVTNTAGLSADFDTYKNSLKNFTDSLLSLSVNNTHIAIASFSSPRTGPGPFIPTPVLSNNSSSIRTSIDNLVVENNPYNFNNNLSYGIDFRAVDSVLEATPLGDRDDAEFPDAILIISDTLPDRPSGNPLVAGSLRARDAKDLGIKIMATIINPSGDVPLDDYYRDDIVSNSSADYASSLDYDASFNNELLTNTLFGLCSL